MRKEALRVLAPGVEKRVWIAILLLGLTVAPLRAERIYFFSADVNVINSIDDNPQVSGLSLGQVGTASDFQYTFGLFPTVRLHSEGPQSQMEFSYSFGLNRVDSELDLDSESNAFGFNYDGNLTPRLSLRLSESFRRSPDFTTQNLFRGIVFSPEGTFFDFETVSQRQTSTENTVSADFQYEIGPASRLEFGGGYSIRDLGDDPAFTNRFSNQDRLQFHFGLSRSLSSRTTWDVRYQLLQLNFDDFEDRRTHELLGGVGYLLTPTTQFSFRLGPSYTESTDTQSDFLGVSSSVSLTQELENNRISLSYNRRNSASTGVGSTSRTDQISFNFDRPLARTVNLALGLSLFDTDQQGDNPISQRGVNGQAILSFLLHQNWTLGLGASFRSQDSDEDRVFNLNRRQFFVTLNFVVPEFWRFQR